MKKIKTREVARTIRIQNETSSITHRMANIYVRAKEQAEPPSHPEDNSPSCYAEGYITDSIRKTTRGAGYTLQYQRKGLAEEARSKVKMSSRKQRGPSPFKKSPAIESIFPNCSNYGRNSVQSNAPESMEQIASNSAAVKSGPNMKMAERSVKHSPLISGKAVWSGAKGAVKASAKTAQATSTAAKATAVAANTGVRAISTAAKTVIGAVKGLITAIAAGAWAAVMVIVIILLAASMLGSVFGLFASEEGYANALSMPEVVSQLNSEFSAKFDKIISANPHDRFVIDNVGTAPIVANWNQVLAVYAVLLATDPESPTEVATLDNKKIEELKAVFWDMNSIRYSVDELTIGTDAETGTPTTETILTITVSSKTAEDMILVYGFTPERAAQLHELLKSEYAELFQQLTGNYQDITLSAAQIAAIMETLPKNLSQERREVVLTAYSLLDKVTYFWGGKSLVLGWDNRWGTPMKVTADGSSTTGMVRPFGMDCSGFVDWVFYNAYDGAYILGRGGGTSSQYSYCDVIAWSSAQPGDLVFYTDCEHVGIVVENKADTLTVIHCASGYNNVVMTQHTRGNGFSFVGRPQIYE